MICILNQIYSGNHEQALAYIDGIKRQYIRLCQKLKRYRGRKKHFNISKKEGKGAIFLCSLNLKWGDFNGAVGNGSIEILNNLIDVVGNWINTTKTYHFRQNQSNNNPLII